MLPLRNLMKLPDKSKQEINDLVDELMDKYEEPIDIPKLKQIARGEYRVEECIKVSFKTRPIIGYGPDNVKKYIIYGGICNGHRKITLAHEIGHAARGHKGYWWLEDIEEPEAWYFASQLTGISKRRIILYTYIEEFLTFINFDWLKENPFSYPLEHNYHKDGVRFDEIVSEYERKRNERKSI